MDKFVSFLDETKSSCTTFFQDFKTWQSYPNIQSESDQILQNVRKGVVAEISAFQQFVKAEKICQNSGSFHDLYHYNRAVYYLTV